MPVKDLLLRKTAPVAKVNWNKTVVMKARLREELEKKPDGDYFKGRKIISRDTPIDKGVYLGENEREAIVVDSKKYPALNALYEKARKKATSGGKVDKTKVLNAVFEVSTEAMPNMQLSDVKKILNRLGAGPDEKVALDVFIESKTGVCRHHALTCGALLEMFKNGGHISGNASVDRNNSYQGGHAWCRYTNSKGEVFILDPAQKFIGKLSESKGKWPYHRPEDAK